MVTGKHLCGESEYNIAFGAITNSAAPNGP
jgi:hypothetical protein